jgi:hypothetical protein
LLFIHPRIAFFLSLLFQQIITHTTTIITLILAAAASVWAIPFPSVTVSDDHFEILRLHASAVVNADAVTGTTRPSKTA